MDWLSAIVRLNFCAVMSFTRVVSREQVPSSYVGVCNLVWPCADWLVPNVV